MKETCVFVGGLPLAKGSWRNIRTKGGKNVLLPGNPKEKDWSRAVREAVSELASPQAGPIKMTLEFIMPRPKLHFGRKGLKASAPIDHAKKPDIDKLIRSILDACTGAIYFDDCQVCDLLATKRFGDGIGAMISWHVLDAPRSEQ